MLLVKLINVGTQLFPGIKLLDMIPANIKRSLTKVKFKTNINKLIRCDCCADVGYIACNALPLK